MTHLQCRPERVLGFDVAKDSITIFDGAANTLTTIANTQPAIGRFLRRLEPAGRARSCLSVLELTGGYEATLLAALLAADMPCHRADTTKVSAFIRSLGTLAKTDALDARGLARYGQERWDRLDLFTAPDQDIRRLNDLVTRRRQLLHIRVAETNRAKATGSVLRQSARALLRTLNTQITKIDQAIDALIEANTSLHDTLQRYQALPGIGRRTAITLLAGMPELGHLTRRQAAALAAVAPHPRDSGTLRGYRSMRGGRPQIRAALFMAALAASRAEGHLKTFYKRLIQNGKKPIVAIAALMRKIIVILNARQRDALLQQQS